MYNKRYIAHDFLIGNPILVDRLASTLTLYNANINGQLYDLKNPSCFSVSIKVISGLIRRTHNENYGFRTAKAVDSYVYAYLMTAEQQAACKKHVDIPDNEALIIATDDYAEAIAKMCEWAYDNGYCKQLGDKEAWRRELLQYYKDFLNDTGPTNTRAAPAQPGGGKVMPRKRSAPQREAR